MLCILAGARFGEVAVTFFVANTIVGEVGMMLKSFTLRGKRKIWSHCLAGVW